MNFFTISIAKSEKETNDVMKTIMFNIEMNSMKQTMKRDGVLHSSVTPSTYRKPMNDRNKHPSEMKNQDHMFYNSY